MSQDFREGRSLRSKCLESELSGTSLTAKGVVSCTKVKSLSLPNRVCSLRKSVWFVHCGSVALRGTKGGSYFRSCGHPGNEGRREGRETLRQLWTDMGMASIFLSQVLGFVPVEKKLPCHGPGRQKGGLEWLLISESLVSIGNLGFSNLLANKKNKTL